MSERLTPELVAEIESMAALGARAWEHFAPAGSTSAAVEVIGTGVPSLIAEVRALWAEREADDARMLELEWQGHEGCCPWCGRSKFHSHTIDCAMKQRCDEARARQVQ